MFKQSSYYYYYVSYRKCGIPDPSWSEIRHFVSFLNSQLRDCEHSFYCDMQLMRAVLEGPSVLNLEGFRSFVVRFMIQMSRVSWLFNSSLTQRSIKVMLFVGPVQEKIRECTYVSILDAKNDSFRTTSLRILGIAAL